MGNKSLYINPTTVVPTEDDKFVSANAEDTNQLQSHELSKLRQALGYVVSVEAIDASTAVTTGDKKVGFCIPAIMNGLNLKAVIASVDDKGVTGTTDVTIVKETAGVAADMLSTAITIGDEFFAADGVIDTAEDDVATGDNIYVNVDAIHSGTAPNGLFVTFYFGL